MPGRVQASIVVALLLVVTHCAPPQEDTVDAGYEISVVQVEPGWHSVDVPRDKVFRIELTDHIDSHSVTPDKFSLFSGNVSKQVRVYYSPVTRQIVVWPIGTMLRDTVWTLEMKEGIKGLNDQRVAPEVLTSFTTGSSTGDEPAFQYMTYQSDIKPIFEASCVSCHSSVGGYAKLDLSSASGIEKTALGISAVGRSWWNRVEPYSPGKSYLLYKLTLTGNSVVAGDPMPRSMDGSFVEPLSLEKQRQISDWIVGGTPFFDLRDNNL